MRDWFLVAILERFEAMEQEEKIEFLHRFMINPEFSTRPDYFIWASEKDGQWNDVFEELCEEMVEDYEPFNNLPECFQSALLHYLNGELLEPTICEQWIEYIKEYANADDFEFEDYEFYFAKQEK
jgi:hypothetical protein